MATPEGFIGKPLATFVVVLSGIPATAPLSSVSEALVATASCEYAQLAAPLRDIAVQRVRLVPTKLHIFKEALDTPKFGFVQFVAAELPPDAPVIVGCSTALKGEVVTPSRTALEAAVQGWAEDVTASPAPFQARFMPASDMAALDATALIPSCTDPMKMLCLAASKLRRDAAAAAEETGSPLRLHWDDFSEAEVKMMSELHKGAFAEAEGARERFLQLRGSSTIVFA